MMPGPGFKRCLKQKLQSEGATSKVRNHRRNVVAAGGRTVATTSNTDNIYASWLRDHPSALGSLKEMMNMARGKHIVVFLDYDGTLSPIVSDPDRAFMSNKMRSAVSEVSMHFPTAIISGRSRNKVQPVESAVYEFVNLKWVYYAGSHGMDIKGPSQQVTSYDCKYQTRALDEHGDEFIIFQPAREYLPDIQEMIDELAEKTREIEGVVIEDNRFCISVHYRHVKDEEYEDLKRRVKLVVEKNGCFRLTEGKKVMEIRPSIEWDKGHALEYLLEALGFSNTNDVLPIYIGDDRTDEDAFKVLRSRGVGFPIIVSSKPRETAALYSLRDPSEVLSFLVRMANWTLANYSQR